MSDSNDWLPGLVLLSDYGGNWDTYEDALYGQYCQDFIRSHPTYPGKRWALQEYPQDRGKAERFWHVISSGADEATRHRDLRRCERIRWPRCMLDAIKSNRVKAWHNKRGRDKRIVVAVGDFSYVVILAVGGKYVRLITAYQVEQRHRRAKFEKEYEEARINGLTAPS